MRIAHSDRRKVTFEEIGSGQTFAKAFVNSAEPYIKMMYALKDCDGNKYNAISLRDGSIYYFERNQTVYVVDGTFVEGYKND